MNAVVKDPPAQLTAAERAAIKTYVLKVQGPRLSEVAALHLSQQIDSASDINLLQMKADTKLYERRMKNRTIESQVRSKWSGGHLRGAMESINRIESRTQSAELADSKAPGNYLPQVDPFVAPRHVAGSADIRRGSPEINATAHLRNPTDSKSRRP